MTVEELRGMTHEDLVRRVQELEEANEKLAEEKNYYDEEMLGYFNQHHKLLENSKFITLIRSSVCDETVNFITDYVLARKLFIPNLDAVKKLKEQTIFNKKENENN